MKQRVTLEDGIELSTICRQLKMVSADGKKYATDCASVQSLLRIIQSIPSPKAETGTPVVTGDNFLPPADEPEKLK